jgi:hypothetical protein
VPFSEDLVLNHLHFLLAVSVFSKFWVFANVFEQNFLDLFALVVTYNLRNSLLGRLFVHFDDYVLLRISFYFLQLLSGTFQGHFFSSHLDSLQISHSEFGQITEGSQQGNGLDDIILVVVF